jgi:hypothetical protein
VACLKHNWCVTHLSDNHEVVAVSTGGQKSFRPHCLPPASAVKYCTRCKAWHHKLLSCADKANATEGVQDAVMEAASMCVIESSVSRSVHLLAQKFQTNARDELIAFWDFGLQVAMLTHRSVATAGLWPEAAASMHVKDFKSKGVVLAKGYHIPLQTKEGVHAPCLSTVWTRW